MRFQWIFKSTWHIGTRSSSQGFRFDHSISGAEEPPYSTWITIIITFSVMWRMRHRDRIAKTKSAQFHVKSTLFLHINELPTCVKQRISGICRAPPSNPSLCSSRSSRRPRDLVLPIPSWMVSLGFSRIQSFTQRTRISNQKRTQLRFQGTCKTVALLWGKE